MKSCAVCSIFFESHEEPDRKVCSNSCDHGQELSEHLRAMMVNTKPSEDPRIFYYPLSFGQLVDRHSILSLRRAHTRSIRRQQETDYLLFKVGKAIQTQLAQIFQEESFRKALASLALKLFCVNARIWRLNDLLQSERTPSESRLKIFENILAEGYERDRLIRELDLMIVGRSTEYRVYGSREV